MTSQATDSVTFLFTDIEGSSLLWESHTEAMSQALSKHDGILRGVFESCEGHIFKTIGDAFCVAFPVARCAFESAIMAQRVLQNQTWEGIGQLKVRMALHTGSAYKRDDDYFGPVLSRVSRILSAARGGQILLTFATGQLVHDQLPDHVTLRDLGERLLRGHNRPERIFQVVATDLPCDFHPTLLLQTYPEIAFIEHNSIIGHDKLTEQVNAIFDTPFVLTFAGTGDAVMCRFVQLSIDILDQFPSGVCLAEFASLKSPVQVTDTVATIRSVHQEPER